MPTSDEGDGSPLAPSDAFSGLGNGTRMEILRILAEADSPLPFSELYDRGSVTDSGNFTYHLDKLVGHFVEETEDGYELRRAGERIVEAVVSGAVTETPVIEPTRVDWPCSLCGTSMVISYREEWMAASCPECEGYQGSADTDDPLSEDQLGHGYLGGATLPPAGIEGRDAAEVLQAALAWDFLERITLSNGICPRCSAAVERSLSVCENHDSGDGRCEHCNNEHQELCTVTCPNCHLEQEMILPSAVHGYPIVLNFVTAHGFNPVVPTKDQWETMRDITDVVVASTDPVRVQISYSLDGHVLTVTVDENIDVVDVTETGRPNRDRIQGNPSGL